MDATNLGMGFGLPMALSQSGKAPAAHHLGDSTPPLVAIPGVVQTRRCDDLRTVGLEIQPWARVKLAQRAIERKIMMWPLLPESAMGVSGSGP